jgi:hypothetical protein
MIVLRDLEWVLLRAASFLLFTDFLPLCTSYALFFGHYKRIRSVKLSVSKCKCVFKA